MTCPLCKGIGWVCERHPDRPFDGSSGCTCGGGETPCPACNAGSIVPNCPGKPSLPLAKRAVAFFEELAQAVFWIEPTSIVLTERRSNARSNVNWAVTTSPLIASTREAFDSVISRWQALELHLEWDGVAFRGERRMLVKWIFPHDAAVAPCSSAGSQDRRGRADEREQHFVVEAGAVALWTSEAEQLRTLEEKNAKLKELLTEQMLVAAALRELLPRKS